MSEVAVELVGELFPPVQNEMTVLSVLEQQHAKQKQQAKCEEVWMTDLVLHHVLDYVVEGKNYVTMSLVCKRWKTLLATRFPPAAAFYLLLLMERGRTLKKEHVKVLVSIFESLRRESCPMYRLKASQHTAASWPRLQSRYRARLMNVVYEMCIQRSPHNQSRQVYESTCSFLESHATRAAQDMLKTMATQEPCTMSQALPLLQQLQNTWREWEGGVSVVCGLTKYVNKCPWVRLPAQALARPNLTIQQSAKASMATQIANVLISLTSDDEELQESKPLLVSWMLEKDATQLTFRERCLLLLACQICTHVSDYPCFPTARNTGAIDVPPVLCMDKSALPYLLAIISSSSATDSAVAGKDCSYGEAPIDTFLLVLGLA